MNPLHRAIESALLTLLNERRVVVWQDPDEAFGPFFTELGVPTAAATTARVRVGDVDVQVVVAGDSLYEARFRAEPFVAAERPAPTLVYLPGRRLEPKSSVLLELELAGARYVPQLKSVARSVLLERYPESAVDQVLGRPALDWQELVAAVSAGTGDEPPSVLSSLFPAATTPDERLRFWLESDDVDERIGAKGGSPELVGLIRSLLAIEVSPSAPLPELRLLVTRAVLLSEFYADLRAPAPESLRHHPVPRTEPGIATARRIARDLRRRAPTRYVQLADGVERDLGLANLSLAPESLGTIDTFRFEERALLGYAVKCLGNGGFETARTVARQRAGGFWLDQDLVRHHHWALALRMAELGVLCDEIGAAMSRSAPNDSAEWMATYTRAGGWYRLDRAQRDLEALISEVHEEPDERALAIVRRRYEDVIDRIAEAFTAALERSQWLVPGWMRQTDVWSEWIAPHRGPGPIALFMVDAMRYEMAVALEEKLHGIANTALRSVLSVLPSITPMGMAALLPGADSRYSVIEADGKLGARIHDTFLPDLPARKKWLTAKEPGVVDLSLDELNSLRATERARRIAGARVIVVRSQEIDHAGENGFSFQARRVMNDVLGAILRALKLLHQVGVRHAVLTADHGHLFHAEDRDEASRLPAPGGHTVDLHRRCWVGRGGTTPPGTVRVAAAALGYESDLDFVFPRGAGVFRCGGDLAFHHGGLSLQERAVPVLTVTYDAAPEGAGLATNDLELTVTDVPARVTNRVFTVKVVAALRTAGGSGRASLRAHLLHDGRVVGRVGLAVGGELDRETGVTSVSLGEVVTLAFKLEDDTVAHVRLLIVDAATEAELYGAGVAIPVQLGV